MDSVREVFPEAPEKCLDCPSLLWAAQQVQLSANMEHAATVRTQKTDEQPDSRTIKFGMLTFQASSLYVFADTMQKRVSTEATEAAADAGRRWNRCEGMQQEGVFRKAVRQLLRLPEIERCHSDYIGDW